MKKKKLLSKDKTLWTSIRETQLQDWFSNSTIRLSKKASMISLMAKREFSESEKTSSSKNNSADLTKVIQKIQYL